MSAGGGPNEPFDWTRPTPPGSLPSPGASGGPVGAPGGANGPGAPRGPVTYGSTGSGSPWQPSSPPPRRRARSVWIVVALVIGLPGVAFIVFAGICLAALSQSSVSPEEQAARSYDALRSLPTIEEATDRNDRLVQKIHAMLQAKYGVGPLQGSGTPAIQPCRSLRFDAQVRASTVSFAKPGVPAASWAQAQEDIAALVQADGFSSRAQSDPTPMSTAYYWHPKEVSSIWVRGYPDFKIAWRCECLLTAAGKAVGTAPPTAPPQPASTPFPRDGDLWPSDRTAPIATPVGG